MLYQAGNNPDVLIVAPEDSRVVRIDQIRSLIDFAWQTSHAVGRQVIILEQAEAMNPSAANALLKTLEEPPGQLLLLLITDNPGKLLPTIRSRCQRIVFNVPERDAAALAWL